ncbi:hypothetical protein ASZ90_006382 [hydrocarbon metagenome]|uniref:Uncharacterized protein n=1 Tax=hydrocarbon metagenome TaxID=938273 RepID=A0A0W8FSB9_9ZZZZ
MLLSFHRHYIMEDNAVGRYQRYDDEKVLYQQTDIGFDYFALNKGTNDSW